MAVAVGEAVLVGVLVGVKLDVALGALVSVAVKVGVLEGVAVGKSVLVAVTLGTAVCVSLGRTKKVAVGVLLGVLLATTATMVGWGVLETSGVGLGVRVGAIVGVTSGTDRLQAASSRANRITLRRIMMIPHTPTLLMIIDIVFGMRDGRMAYGWATG